MIWLQKSFSVKYGMVTNSGEGDQQECVRGMWWKWEKCTVREVRMQRSWRILRMTWRTQSAKSLHILNDIHLSESLHDCSIGHNTKEFCNRPLHENCKIERLNRFCDREDSFSLLLQGAPFYPSASTAFCLNSSAFLAMGFHQTDCFWDRCEIKGRNCFATSADVAMLPGWKGYWRTGRRYKPSKANSKENKL
jgi:hypothetical protein